VIAVLVIAGCALLAARPALLHLGQPVLVITALFVGLLAVAVTAPLPEAAAPRSRRRMAMAIAIGTVAFVVGRVVVGGAAPAALSGRVLVLNTLAAVAEEAFFRRLVFGALAGAGAFVAIGGTALLFALVHLSVYGAWVLPLDAAAGLLFGWQRWSTGSWSVPAATHVVANVLVVV
jgi:membrane protease YdiL (CAAX protease family)